MEENKTQTPAADDPQALIRKRNILLSQRNRMTYGLSLGAVLLVFGVGGGKIALILAAALIFAVGGYFMLEIIKQTKDTEAKLRRYYPNGIPDKQPK